MSCPFTSIRETAIAGILDIIRRHPLHLYWSKDDDDRFPDLVFLRFQFSPTIRADEMLRITQAVLDIAELLTFATRNRWQFTPHLCGESIPGTLPSIFYAVPIPSAHLDLIREIAIERPLDSVPVAKSKAKRQPKPRRVTVR